MMRRSIWALGAGATAAAVPALASALLVWTLTPTAFTATANQSTTFTLTATNLTPLLELGCVQVDLQGFVIESIGTPAASNSKAWVSIESGGSVIVYSVTAGGRLTIGQWVTFTIRADANSAGAFLWTNHAHQQRDCSGTAEIGVPLSVTVLPALVATPTPAPTAVPTPTATPTPAPSLPLPSISLLPSVSLLPSISQLPSVSLLPSLPPGSSGATPSPAATVPPSAGQTSQPTGTPGPSSSVSSGGVPGSTGEGAGGGAADAPATPALHLARGAGNSEDTGISVDMPGVLDLNYGWLVPAAPVAVPGLLVILWVFLQAIGALAWIPSVRRMADESAAPHRRLAAKERA
ncbi:MAG TPA: hypothetical protein VK600_04290 [Candidatus Saccharimonadales bacterium]|nr:hypothetical protein [Candidatus Saccharimonadales bacterium]